MEVFGELKNFQKEMAELSTFMQFLSDKVDSTNTLMSEMKVELVELIKENQDLRAATVSMNSKVEKPRTEFRVWSSTQGSTMWKSVGCLQNLGKKLKTL